MVLCWLGRFWLSAHRRLERRKVESHPVLFLASDNERSQQPYRQLADLGLATTRVSYAIKVPSHSGGLSKSLRD